VEETRPEVEPVGLGEPVDGGTCQGLVADEARAERIELGPLADVLG